MAHYYCKCGKETTGRFAKANMVRHILKQHNVKPWQNDEPYSAFRERYEQWIEGYSGWR